MCKVSVVMSVYNCEKYVGATIESIISQTFTDWEFIIINDASKDNSADVIRQYKDDRIIFIDNAENKGQCANLNYGIAMAKGEYIARTDHDDISYNTRFEKQVRYMDEHPDIVLLGACMDYIKDGETLKGGIPPFNGPEEVAFSLAFSNYCIPHSSFMMRRKILSENNIKYEKYLFAEDYHMQHQLLKYGKLDFLHEFLIGYRYTPGQCSQVYSRELIIRENIELKTEYIKGIGVKNTDIMEKLYTCGLETEKDYLEFDKAFKELAEYNNIPSTDIKNGNAGLRMLYMDMLLNQKKNINNMNAYLSSPYRNEKWLATRAGQAYLDECRKN